MGISKISKKIVLLKEYDQKSFIGRNVNKVCIIFSYITASVDAGKNYFKWGKKIRRQKIDDDAKMYLDNNHDDFIASATEYLTTNKKEDISTMRLYLKFLPIKFRNIFDGLWEALKFCVVPDYFINLLSTKSNGQDRNILDELDIPDD